jgi:peptide/nickel transport system permease protein
MSFSARSVLRRLVTLVVTTVVASIVVFGVTSLLPSSPAQMILGTQGTPQQIAALNAKLGLDRPLVDQYLHWMGELIRWHLGTSYVSQIDISTQLSEALSVTVPLVVLGLVIALVIGIGFGILGARHERRLGGVLASALSQLGLSVPSFALGLLLISLFAVRFHLLPAGGFTAWSVSPWEAFRSLLLPGLALGVVEAAIIAKYTRVAVGEIFRSRYYQSAIANGATPTRALWRHGPRNVAVSLLTVVSLELVGLLVGAVVIENVFSLPGLGTLLLNAVQNRDLVVVQDAMMVVAVLVFLANALGDIAYGLVDPRLWHKSEGCS